MPGLREAAQLVAHEDERLEAGELDDFRRQAAQLGRMQNPAGEKESPGGDC